MHKRLIEKIQLLLADHYADVICKSIKYEKDEKEKSSRGEAMGGRGTLEISHKTPSNVKRSL